MATRKQRARRAKTFRHEYALVETDEEGNEIELKATELRAKKQDSSGKGATRKPAPKTSSRSGSSNGARPLREPPPPSWERALKRGLLWGIIAGGAATFLLHGPIVLAAMYAVLFVPLTYWTDGYAYRRFERKKAEQSAERGSPRSGKAH
jgi:hypothetical protein